MEGVGELVCLSACPVSLSEVPLGFGLGLTRRTIPQSGQIHFRGSILTNRRHSNHPPYQSRGH